MEESRAGGYLLESLADAIAEEERRVDGLRQQARARVQAAIPSLSLFLSPWRAGVRRRRRSGRGGRKEAHTASLPPHGQERRCADVAEVLRTLPDRVSHRVMVRARPSRFRGRPFAEETNIMRVLIISLHAPPLAHAKTKTKNAGAAGQARVLPRAPDPHQRGAGAAGAARGLWPSPGQRRGGRGRPAAGRTIGEAGALAWTGVVGWGVHRQAKRRAKAASSRPTRLNGQEGAPMTNKLRRGINELSKCRYYAGCGAAAAAGRGRRQAAAE